jgi:hypothetical protein
MRKKRKWVKETGSVLQGKGRGRKDEHKYG